ncbi:MAG: hypothetical protein DHS20C17_24170 [Cyclobacteriaceae bacterium]|nr:MAG: hypothetical protein DHS20C17_24170 [Cyclobacteriaceae bacterium]
MQGREKCIYMLSLLCLPLVNQLTAQSRDTVDSTGADYGELKVLTAYDNPGSKSGHISLGLFDGVFNSYFDFKDRFQAKTGLNYMIEYAPIFQWDFGGDGGSNFNDELNLIGQWALVDKENPSRGNLIMWYQLSHTIGSQTTTEFMEELGIITPVNGGDTHPVTTNGRFVHFAWEQYFLDEKIRLMVGKLSSRVFLNLNRYGVSDREDFINFMFVNNPVVPFIARQGLGAFVKYNQGSWYLGGMFRDATASNDFIDFESLKDNSWEYALELGLTPSDFLGLGEGNYRFTFHCTDSLSTGLAHPSGWTLSLSFDQDLGDKLGAMFRYSYASEDFLAFKERFVLGAQVLTPFNFQNDRIGVGFWWGRSVDKQLDPEFGLEAYWKIQFTPFMEFSPDLQVVLNPAKNHEKDALFIGGLRFRVVL